MSAARSALVTGAGGYLGSLLIDSLAADRGDLETVVASDVREPAERHRGIEYVTRDVRDPALADDLSRFGVDAVVHLAAIVSPGRKPDRALEYSIDVGGTGNVLESCLAAGVRHVTISSSGAAYGYHSDNPECIDENDALRGNHEFAYSDHKRQIEEILTDWRAEHPELGQLILRSGTILGAHTRNQITDLFDRRLILGLRGSATPFVFIWDQDLVAIIRQGLETGATGIYNVAGDGVVTQREIAALLGKPFVPIPVGVVRGALATLKPLGLTQYGPEQVDFLRYRPVLSNRRLKEEFGYTPEKSSSEAFAIFAEGRRG